MQEIKKKLSSRYLKTWEYFDILFISTKKILEKRTLWLIGYIGIVAMLNYMFGIVIKNKIITNVNLISLINSIKNVFLEIVIMKRFFYEIEEDEKLLKISLKPIIVVSMIMFLFEFILNFATTNNNDLLSGIVSIGLITIVLNLLYFTELYVCRNLPLKEAFFYNLHLSKNNRIRMIKVLIVLFLIFLILNIPSIGFVIIGSSVSIITTLIVGGIIAILRIFLSSIVYLNVEYMDLKKLNKNK